MRPLVILAAAAISGCGAQLPPPVAPAAPVSVKADAVEPRLALRKAEVRAGVAPGRVLAPTARERTTAEPVRVNPEPAAAPSQRSTFKTFRRAQLAGLRAHCSTGPPDPRCDGTRVNKAVTFSGLEPTR